jgi:alpha,alpha-trehalose phosphorylase
MFLLGDEFSIDEKKRNFDYYDPLTTGDSSLSVGIQSIVAFELGYLEKANEYARYAVLMDLADIGGNVSDGVHMAAMGATWMVLVYGFAGMRDYDGQLSFNPVQFEGQGRIRFPLTVRGQRIEVDMKSDCTTYTLLKGDSLIIRHRDEEIRLSPDNPSAVCPMIAAGGS